MFDGEPVIMVNDSAIIRFNPGYRHHLIIYHVTEIKKASLSHSARDESNCKSLFQLSHSGFIESEE